MPEQPDERAARAEGPSVGLAVPLPGDPLATEMGPERASLKQRAVVGAFVVVVRGVLIRVLGTAGYLVLAGLLSPAEFGVVAFGLAITFTAKFFADGGLATALIRRPNTPSLHEYQVALGVQFGAASLFALGAVAWWLLARTEVAAVTMLFVLSLPLIAFRTPNLVALERELDFRPTAIGEVAEVCVYTAAAITLVVLGSGPAALGIATITKTAVGTGVINRLGPMGWLPPRFSARGARQILPFGIKVSASDAVTLGRDQGLNAMIAAVAGYGTLGLWTIANRVFTLPLLLFESLWRVSLPTMVQVKATRDDAGDIMVRGVSLGAVIGTVALVPFAVSASPAIALLLGAQWHESGVVVPWFCLGMAVGAPLGAAALGYLYAEDAAGAVLVITTAGAAVLLATSAAMLLLVGYVGLGIGWAIGATTIAVLLDRAVKRRSGVSLLRPVVRPTAAGALATAIGLALLSVIQEDIVAIVAGGLAATVAYVLMVGLLDREGLRYAVATVAGVAQGRRS